MTPARAFLRSRQPTYRNFAYQTFTNYATNHTFPFTDAPKAAYNSLGNYLITGYDLYSWTEQRTSGLDYLSAIFKNSNVFLPAFDDLVVARDSQQSWATAPWWATVNCVPHAAHAVEGRFRWRPH